MGRPVTLDGIPLAIELAAARVRLLSVEQIAAALSDPFRLLTGGVRTALARHQTLLASVEWSHELLEQPERTLLRRLGVFLGGFTLDGCEDVCSGEGLGRPAVLNVLASLVDKSLVLAHEHDGRTRYRLLETMRQYALHQLGAADETEPLRERHRDSFASYARWTEPELITNRLPGALDLLDAEAANLHAAIEHDGRTNPEIAATMCTSLMLWRRLRGLFPAGLGAVARTLAALPDGPSRARGRTLCASAYLAVNAGEGQLCERSGQEALRVGEALEDDWIQGRALHALTFLWFLTDPQRADQTAQRGRQHALAAGDEFPYADTIQCHAFALWTRDDYASARALLEESYTVAERNGYRDILAAHWMGLALMPWGSPQPGQCQALLERSLAVSAEVHETVIHGFATGQLGWVQTILGEPEAAMDRLLRCREMLVASGTSLPLGHVGIVLGVAQASLRRLDEARATLGGFQVTVQPGRDLGERVQHVGHEQSVLALDHHPQRLVQQGFRGGQSPPRPRFPQAPRRRMGRPDAHRARCGRPRRRRDDQPGDRQPPVHLPGHGQDPPLTHLHQARPAQPHRAHRRGHPPRRPRLSGDQHTLGRRAVPERARARLGRPDAHDR